jgi:capsular polysaccharide biosynthesis protein
MIIQEDESYVAVRKKPVNMVISDVGLFEKEFIKSIPFTNILLIKNVFISNHVIIDIIKFRFYNSYSFVTKIGKKYLLKNLISLLNPLQTEKQGIWIINDWSNGYFHWFADALPRYIYASRYIKNHVVVLPLNYQQSPFVVDSLKLLNVKVVYYNPQKLLFLKELLLPSIVAPTGNYNVKIMHQLRARFTKDVATNANEKLIYISRERATRRKVVNENQLVDFLKSKKFEIHYFEDYTLQAQIKLMQETKCIIALHGAGLTNMLFMKENSFVVEFRNENDNHNNCYFSLASDLNLNYSYINCSGKGGSTQDADVKVDLLKVSALLEELNL